MQKYIISRMYILLNVYTCIIKLSFKIAKGLRTKIACGFFILLVLKLMECGIKIKLL